MMPNKFCRKGMAHWSDADYLAKLKSKAIVTESGCWEMTGFLFTFKVDNGTRGYGAMCYRGKNWRAHRLSWFLHFGKIPRGKVIMHKCDNPPCINPKHLKLGTRAQNNKDMAAKGRYNHQKVTHCPQGHPYDDVNTWLYKTKDGYVFRRCRQCTRNRYARSKQNVHKTAHG